jgi:hypothetical protein
MRARWKAWPDDRDPDGDWQRDSRDAPVGEDWDPDGADKQFEADVTRAVEAMRKALGYMPEKASHVFNEALARMLGHSGPETGRYLIGMGGEDEEDLAGDGLPETGLAGDWSWGKASEGKPPEF